MRNDFRVKMFRYKEVQLDFAKQFRVFISGCSSAGKTYFAHKLLKLKLFHFDRVYYFHPDFHETAPVDWNLNVLFHAGLPSLEDLLTIPEHSVIILDDLYHECVNSTEIDYLYRVLSSKRKLHCIIMTQRYFAQGKFALNIRNSSNYHVLMRNADERTNLRAADTMNLKTEVIKANECNENEMYPYIFIDKTNHARVTGIKVYIDIFSKYPKVVMKSGLHCLVSAKDFNSRFYKIDENVANENSQRNIRESTMGTTEETEDSASGHISDTTGSARGCSGSDTNTTSETNTTGTDATTSGTDTSGTYSKLGSASGVATRESRPSRRELKRRIRQAVQRHQKRSFI